MPKGDSLERRKAAHARLQATRARRLAGKQARLGRITGSVVETITSSIFVDRMRQARAAGGFEAMARLLSLGSLREAGADIPEDFRLTSRTFEDSQEGVRSQVVPGADEPMPKRPYLVGCGGAGAAGICGCGGGLLLD